MAFLVKGRARRSLTGRLIGTIILSSIVATIAVTAVQVKLDHQRNVEAIEKRFADVQRSYLPIIAKNLWLLDPERLQTLLTGISVIPGFQYAEVVAESGKILARTGESRESQVISRSVKLPYEHRGEFRILGTFKLVASLDGAFNEAARNAIFILLTNAIVIFLLVAIIYITVHRIVTRHMARMAAYARNFSTENIDQPLVLDRRVNPGDDDELHGLVTSINEMRSNLKSSYERLNTQNIELENRVAERTSALVLEIQQHESTERELRNSEAKIRAIIASTAEGILTIDDHGLIETFNPAAEQIFGYSAEQVVGNNVSMLMAEDERAEHDVYVADSELHAPRIINQSRDLFGLHQDGTVIPLELNVARMDIAGQQKFVGVLRDISQRKLTEAELADSKREAETANRAKSEFLSSMSHELRTPLNAILGFSQMLQYNPKEPLSGSQQESVDHIMRGGEYLLRLIDMVLDLAKIESGNFGISLESVNPDELCKECLILIESQAKPRGIVIEARYDAMARPIKADYTRFKQVMLNLLSNAIKYNRDGGGVSVTCDDAPDGMVKISVADTGTGIPEERCGELFEPFSRLGVERTDIEGTGIGLTITKQLIEAMGGQIGFKTELGVGSTFWVTMPKATDADTALPSRRLTGRQSKLMPTTNPELEATVLYIEDNPANLRLMEAIIGEVDGLSLISAENAEIGVVMANQRQPDLILMDINLPGLDGIAAMEILQADEKTKDIPVIAVSAAVMPGDIERAMSAGFQSYLTKPIQVPDVIKAIKEILD